MTEFDEVFPYVFKVGQLTSALRYQTEMIDYLIDHKYPDDYVQAQREFVARIEKDLTKAKAAYEERFGLTP